MVHIGKEEKIYVLLCGKNEYNIQEKLFVMKNIFFCCNKYCQTAKKVLYIYIYLTANSKGVIDTYIK